MKRVEKGKHGSTLGTLEIKMAYPKALLEEEKAIDHTAVLIASCVFKHCLVGFCSARVVQGLR